VVNILVNSPAFEAGIRPGDLITRIADKPVHSSQDVVSRVAALPPGSQVEVEGRQSAGKPFRLKVGVIERPISDTTARR
jgi:S1-C subfamily serine protease